MKNVILSLLTLLMRCVYLLFPYSLSKKRQMFKNVIYTAWIRNSFSSMGKHSLISYPCNLQGGGWKQITIGDYTHIHSHCILACWTNIGKQIFNPSVIIGDHCNIGEYTQITSINKVEIGNGVLTGRYVLITDNSHGVFSAGDLKIQPSKRDLISKGEVVIGNNVWLGDRVTILSGVHIGNNVIVGANTVITHDVPSNSMIVGGTSRIIRSL